MPRPLVSVVMPVYNAQAYVGAAVRSIVAQSFQDFEFLIFDDGSTDRSSAILEHWASRDGRLRLFREGHRGYVPWLNEGITRAQGRYLARMDADDLALPQRFARQVAYLESQRACVAVGSDCLLIDPQGWPLRRLEQPRTHEEIDARHLRGQGGGLAHPSVMLRTEAARQIGGYRVDYQYSEDMDLWLRLAEVGRLMNLPEVLLKYRQHFQSVSHLRRQRQLELIGFIVRDACRRRGLPPPRPEDLPTPIEVAALDLQQYWAEVAAGAGHATTARKHFWQVLGQRPRAGHLWLQLLDTTLPPLGTHLRRLWHCLRPWVRHDVTTDNQATQIPQRRAA